VPFCRQTPLTVKAQRAKDYSESPQTLGEHLKKRRRELGLLQREAADRMGILTETFGNWERGDSEPVGAHFRPVVEFLGYDPPPAPATLAERLKAKRRELGVTFLQVARYFGWDEGTLTRYLNGNWRVPSARADELEAFRVAPEADLIDIRCSPKRQR
jgi:transcriptional regulator with XRE-family HTH domain